MLLKLSEKGFKLLDNIALRAVTVVDVQDDPEKSTKYFSSILMTDQRIEVKNNILVQTTSKQFYLHSKTLEDKQEWLHLLQECVLKLRKSSASFVLTNSQRGSNLSTTSLDH
jgi:hypothetical protein